MHTGVWFWTRAIKKIPMLDFECNIERKVQTWALCPYHVLGEETMHFQVI